VAAPSYKDLKFGPMRPADPVQPARFELSNGMKVLLLEDHDTPMVTATAVIRTGSIFDPPERAGLAALTGRLIRFGGTSQRTPDRIDADLDALGATIDSTIGESMGTVALSVLRENLAEALAIFRDLLTVPAFRQDKLDYGKAVIGQAILHRNDDARDVLRREFRALVFGRDSAISRRTEHATIARISRGDVGAFYKRYFFPANVTLAVSGDFDSAQLKGSLESLFGQWKEQQPPVPEFPKTIVKPDPGGYVAVKPDVRETHFSLCLLSSELNEPDTPALEVAAAVLGIGPQSRLMRRAPETVGGLREVRAEWVAGFGQPGIFAINGGGASTATGDSVRMILDEIQKLRAAEITDDELRAARDFVLLKHSAGLDSKAKALIAAVNLEYQGYPPGLMGQFQKAVAAVTRADVLRVARERLDPEKMTVLAVSNMSAFSKPLDPRGGATAAVDLRIAPPAPAEPSTTTAATGELGKQLLARAQQASGGAEKLAAIKDYTQTATYVSEDGARETQTDRWLAPSHLRQDLQSSRIGTVIRYIDGSAGWISNGRTSIALTGGNLVQAREEVLRAYVPLLLSDRLPERAVNGLDEQTVEISWGDLSARLVFDPATGLPAKLLYELRIERQPVLFVEEQYSDFRDVAGIRIPFNITVLRNGIKYSSAAVAEFKINVGTKPEVLQRRP
jgi:zinc protease